MLTGELAISQDDDGDIGYWLWLERRAWQRLGARKNRCKYCGVHDSLRLPLAHKKDCSILTALEYALNLSVEALYS